MKIKRILKILRMNQQELKNYVTTILSNNYKNVISTNEYVYAKGNIPVLLVAHLDIVHKTTPSLILTDALQGMLWSPTGIGGDDRCGVVAILDIITKYKPYVLFTTDEEIGALGAAAFTEQVKMLPVKFAIEIDRRGNNQAVFYSCDNKDFHNYILSYGFDKQYGSFTDICTISPAYDIASVNFSAGYFNEHTTSEYISLAALQNTIDKVCDILNEVENQPYYDYQEKVYPTRYYKSYDYDYYEDYWNDYDDGDWLTPKENKRLTEFTEEEWEEYLNNLKKHNKK